MQKKILFFDIDGTLLTEGENRYIPESAKQAIQKAREQGHYAFINTGRCYAELEESLRNLNLDGFVCGCGTYILYHGEVLHHQGIEEKMRREIISDLQDCKLEGLLEGRDCIYYGNYPYKSRMEKIKKEHQKDIPERIADMNRGIPDFDKFCFCITERSDFNKFYEKYQSHFTFIDRGDSFYEIVPIQCSKATGMQVIMDYLHISREDTIAFGDSTNDEAMLQFAGQSVLMGRHDAAIAHYGDYVTDRVENDGIEKALKYYGLLPEHYAQT